jgi:ATP-dependent Clp protease ATP-binding subunit ClpB
LQGIIDIQLKSIERRLAERKIHLTLSKNARGFIAKEGYDPAFGARPLKRTLQRLILNPLSTKIIAGEFKENDNITADLKRDASGETVVFKKI